MASAQYIWTVERKHFDGTWEVEGYFSTEENAKIYMDAAIADTDICPDPEDFRIDWHTLDMEYV